MANIFAHDISAYRNIPVATILLWEGALFPGTLALKHRLPDQNGSMQDLLEKTIQLVSNLKNSQYQQLVIVKAENKVFIKIPALKIESGYSLGCYKSCPY